MFILHIKKLNVRVIYALKSNKILLVTRNMAIKVDFENKNYYKSGSLILFLLFYLHLNNKDANSRFKNANYEWRRILLIYKTGQAGDKITPILLLSYLWLVVIYLISNICSKSKFDLTWTFITYLVYGNVV